jgi:hypothetical protein
MIRKSGYRFSEKIMLKQEAKAKWGFDLKSFRFSHGGQKTGCAPLCLLGFAKSSYI